MRQIFPVSISIIAFLLSNCNPPNSTIIPPDPSLVLNLEIANSIVNTSLFPHSISSLNPHYGPDRSGNANQALNFTGTGSSYVEIAPDTTLDFNSKSFTISLWLKADANQPDAAIITKGIANQEQFSIGLNADGKYRFWVRDSMANLFIINASVSPDNVWHSLSAIYDHSGDSLYFYQDTTLLGKTIAPGKLFATQEPLYVGARKDQSGMMTYGFKGLMSEIKIYNRVVR